MFIVITGLDGSSTSTVAEAFNKLDEGSDSSGQVAYMKQIQLNACDEVLNFSDLSNHYLIPGQRR